MPFLRAALLKKKAKFQEEEEKLLPPVIVVAESEPEPDLAEFHGFEQLHRLIDEKAELEEAKENENAGLDNKIHEHAGESKTLSDTAEDICVPESDSDGDIVQAVQEEKPEEQEESKPESESESELEYEPEQEVTAEPEIEPEHEHEAIIESKAEPEQEVISKVEAVHEISHEQVQETLTETQIELEHEQSESQDHEAEPEAEPEAEQKVTSEAESESEIGHEPEHEAITESEAESESELGVTEVKAEAEAEPEIESEFVNEPEPEEFKLKYDFTSGERYVDSVSTKTEFDKMLDELSAISGELLSHEVEKFAKEFTEKFQGDFDKAESDAKKYEAFLGGYITNAAMILYDNGYRDTAIKRLEQAKSILEARKKLEDETAAIKTRVEEDNDSVDLSDILGLFGD